MAEPWSNRNDLFASPPASVQTVEEGFLLSGNNNQDNQSAINQFFSCLILGILGIFLFFFWWFFLFIFLSIGLIFLCLWIFHSPLLAELMSHFRLLPGELILSRYPLRLGDEYQFTFRRSSKGKHQTLKTGQLIFSLVCAERVEYRRGTDTETEVETVWTSPPITYPLDSGLNSFSMNGSFQIPIDLPPSFEGKHNQIRWVVLIQQDLPGIAEKIYSNFTVVVDPVIVL